MKKNPAMIDMLLIPTIRLVCALIILLFRCDAYRGKFLAKVAPKNVEKRGSSIY